MNKKVLFSLIGITLISFGISTVNPVLAVSTESSSTASKENESNLSSKSGKNQTKNPAATETSETQKKTKPNDEKKEPTSAKNKNKTNNSKAFALISKYVKLTKNANVYDKKGKRVKNQKLTKGQIIYINGFNNRKNQFFLSYIIPGKTKKIRYVKINDVKFFKAAQYKLRKKSFVYDSKGKARLSPKNGQYYIKKGKKVIVFKVKKIRGIKYADLDNNVYVKWTDLDPKSYRLIQ